MEKTNGKLNFDFRRIYKKLFIKKSFNLFLCDINYKLINFLAAKLFSKAKRRTKILMFTNNLLNKKICERQKLYDKCECLRKKLAYY